MPRGCSRVKESERQREKERERENERANLRRLQPAAISSLPRPVAWINVTTHLDLVRCLTLLLFVALLWPPSWPFEAINRFHLLNGELLIKGGLTASWHAPRAAFDLREHHCYVIDIIHVALSYRIARRPWNNRHQWYMNWYMNTSAQIYLIVRIFLSRKQVDLHEVGIK